MISGSSNVLVSIYDCMAFNLCHISSGKVKTNMLLIWVGPDGEDIYENFNLLPHHKHVWTMYLEGSKNFVSQCAISERPD